jgi:hypothetical protein
VARAVLAKSTWSVLALTCHIEIFVLAHYRESIAPDAAASELWKDVFLHHGLEESQHAIIDEIEWRREHRTLFAEQRDAAVNDLIQLVGMVDAMLQAQARADADYFIAVCGRPLLGNDAQRVHAGVLDAYRWQYIVSGIQDPRFSRILGSMVTEDQATRMHRALAPLMT